MMQYVHCLRNINNQSSAICRQIIRIDIEVEYFCDNVIYHYPTSVRIFLQKNARNLVWNWYGSMEDCLPFHSILASSIPKFPFHSIPCPVAGIAIGEEAGPRGYAYVPYTLAKGTPRKVPTQTAAKSHKIRA